MVRDGHRHLLSTNLKYKEDRDRFVILQQVGLDEHEVKQMHQPSSADRLYLIFAFLHGLCLPYDPPDS